MDILHTSRTLGTFEIADGSRFDADEAGPAPDNWAPQNEGYKIRCPDQKEVCNFPQGKLTQETEGIPDHTSVMVAIGSVAACIFHPGVV